MKKLSTAVITTSLSLAVLAMGISPSMAQPVTSLDNEALVPGLAQPQSREDLNVANGLPDVFVSKVDRSTVRLIAQNASGKYSAALDITGLQICFISQSARTQGFLGVSCRPKEEFAQTGLSVGLQDNGTSTEAYLVPADVETAPLKAKAGLGGGPMTGRDTAHVVVQTGPSALPPQVELDRRNSAVKFQFSTILRPSR